MKSATSSPNARPWTLGKGRPIGTAEVPPICSARPWVIVVSHGIIWESTVFRNKTVNFERDCGLSTPTHHLVAHLPLITSGSHSHRSALSEAHHRVSVTGCSANPQPPRSDRTADVCAMGSVVPGDDPSILIGKNRTPEAGGRMGPAWPKKARATRSDRPHLPPNVA